MTENNVTAFENLLRTDGELQKRLQAAAASFDITDKSQKEAFEALIAPLAEEAGLPFTFEEGRDLVYGRDLDDAELDAVAGGGGFCYIIGGSTEPETNCNDLAAMGYACAYIGITEGC